MFDRHQVEITVMQFTGHSLPMHQPMSVPYCPILSEKLAYTISSHNCHRNVPLPSGASIWNGMFGRVEGQYTTLFQRQVNWYMHKIKYIYIYSILDVRLLIYKNIEKNSHTRKIYICNMKEYISVIPKKENLTDRYYAIINIFQQVKICM